MKFKDLQQGDIVFSSSSWPYTRWIEYGLVVEGGIIWRSTFFRYRQTFVVPDDWNLVNRK